MASPRIIEISSDLFGSWHWWISFLTKKIKTFHIFLDNEYECPMENTDFYGDSNYFKSVYHIDNWQDCGNCLLSYWLISLRLSALDLSWFHNSKYKKNFNYTMQVYYVMILLDVITGHGQMQLLEDMRIWPKKKSVIIQENQKKYTKHKFSKSYTVLEKSRS